MESIGREGDCKGMIKLWEKKSMQFMPKIYHGIAWRCWDTRSDIYVIMPFNLVVYAIREMYLFCKYLRGKTLLHKIEEMELDRAREYADKLERDLEHGGVDRLSYLGSIPWRKLWK